MIKIDLINIDSDNPKHIVDGDVYDGLFVGIPMKKVELASGVTNNEPSLITPINNENSISNIEEESIEEELIEKYELLIIPNTETLDYVNNKEVTLQGNLIDIETDNYKIADSYKWFLDGNKIEGKSSNITILTDDISKNKSASEVKLEVIIDGKKYTDYSIIYLKSNEDELIEEESNEDELIEKYELSIIPNTETLDYVNNKEVTLQGNLIDIETDNYKIADSYKWFLDGNKIEGKSSNITILTDDISKNKSASEVKLEVIIDGKKYTDYSIIYLKSNEDELIEEESNEDELIEEEESNEDELIEEEESNEDELIEEEEEESIEEERTPYKETWQYANYKAKFPEKTYKDYLMGLFGIFKYSDYQDWKNWERENPSKTYIDYLEMRLDAMSLEEIYGSDNSSNEDESNEDESNNNSSNEDESNNNSSNEDESNEDESNEDESNEDEAEKEEIVFEGNKFYKAEYRMWAPYNENKTYEDYLMIRAYGEDGANGNEMALLNKWKEDNPNTSHIKYLENLIKNREEIKDNIPIIDKGNNRVRF